MPSVPRTPLDWDPHFYHLRNIMSRPAAWLGLAALILAVLVALGLSRQPSQQLAVQGKGLAVTNQWPDSEDHNPALPSQGQATLPPATATAQSPTLPPATATQEPAAPTPTKQNPTPTPAPIIATATQEPVATATAQNSKPKAKSSTPTPKTQNSKPKTQNSTPTPSDSDAMRNAQRADLKGVTPTPAPQIQYTVLHGDTLAGIAQKSGVPIKALMATNGITSQKAISASQVLVIPPLRKPSTVKLRPPPPGDKAIQRHTPDFAVLAPPSISAAQIDRILKENGSPVTGRGALFYSLGVKYGIDPAYALAFFLHESGGGTLGIARVTDSIGNRRMTVGSPEYQGFRYYPTWEDSIEDWYILISVQYAREWGLRTVSKIVPVYAPNTDDNDVPGYIADVQTLVRTWSTGPNGPPAVTYPPSAQPALAGHANLLPHVYHVITEFGHLSPGGPEYGLDLDATIGVTQTAPIGGVVEALENNCLPGAAACGHGLGNYIWWKSAETGHHILLSHLWQVNPALHVGSAIKPGTVMGITGSTGRAGSAFVHLQVHPTSMADVGSIDPTQEFPWLSCLLLGPRPGDPWGNAGCP
ncbi:MAG: LysM peptidoglycan-binding domain-containing protein [Chloroflexia bacterium]